MDNFVRETINISSPAGLTIKNLVQTKKKGSTNEDSVVYKIPCGACDKCYVGETYRGIKTRQKEHKSDLRYHRLSNALVQHVDEAGHLPNWDDMSVLCRGLTKKHRQAVEAAYIHIFDNLNGNAGKVKLSRFTAELILHDLKTRSAK